MQWGHVAAGRLHVLETIWNRLELSNLLSRLLIQLHLKKRKKKKVAAEFEKVFLG